MAKVHMMIGIQGSGKTTYSRMLHKETGFPIISTDGIRMAHPDFSEIKVKEEVLRLSAEYLRNNQDVIYDATNITPNVRKRFVDGVKQYNVEFELIAYYFITDINECIERVKLRNQKEGELYLPIEVIASYNTKIVRPTLDEGFTKIIEINNNERRSQ